jgi:hypothetical protein
MRRVRHPRRKAVHSAGILAHEITVSDPFRPLTKQSFIVLSSLLSFHKIPKDMTHFGQIDKAGHGSTVSPKLRSSPR